MSLLKPLNGLSKVTLLGLLIYMDLDGVFERACCTILTVNTCFLDLFGKCARQFVDLSCRPLADYLMFFIVLRYMCNFLARAFIQSSTSHTHVNNSCGHVTRASKMYSKILKSCI